MGTDSVEQHYGVMKVRRRRLLPTLFGTVMHARSFAHLSRCPDIDARTVVNDIVTSNIHYRFLHYIFHYIFPGLFE
jgi:hypothetical protein